MKSLDYCYDGSLEECGRVSRWFNTLFCIVARVILKPLFRYRIYNAEYLRELPLGSSYIIAGNHFSNLDPVFVLLAMRPRRIRFIGKEELFRNPVVAWIGAMMGGFPVKRGTPDRTAIRRAVAILKRGEYLGIFPEGTRIRPTEQESSSREGIALMAQMSGAAVVPVRIWGTDKIKPTGSHCIHFPKVVLRFGEPLSIDEFAHLPKAERFTTFTEEVMRRIYTMEHPEYVSSTGGTSPGTSSMGDSTGGTGQNGTMSEASAGNGEGSDL